MATRPARGLTLIELLIVVAIIGLLAFTAIPSLYSAQRKAKYARAASDTKTAVTQATLYQNDKSQYPGTLGNLRTNGYAAVPDEDPWSTSAAPSQYIVSNRFNNVGGQQVHVCSRGAGKSDMANCDVGDFDAFPAPLTGGAVGYSNVYGSWQPQ